MLWEKYISNPENPLHYELLLRMKGENGEIYYPDAFIPVAERLLKRHYNGNLFLSALAQQKLVSHRWPGNVRELDNVMQRALILRNGDEIDEDGIQISSEAMFDGNVSEAPADDAENSVLNNDLKGREQQLILQALRAGKGSRKYAAGKLGISARTLRYKLARMRDAGITV